MQSDKLRNINIIAIYALRFVIIVAGVKYTRLEK